MESKELILASASPRRSELLQNIGVVFSIASQDVDETILANETPDAYVERVAALKASSAVGQLGENQVVLAADTTVVAGNTILAKPEDEADAYSMLSQLSDSCHRVLTAICVANTQQSKSIIVATKVCFRPLSSKEIGEYWASGEPRGKAGAYGIQGFAATFVKHLEGSYSNVVGLPLFETAALLKEFGVAVRANEDVK